MWDKRYSGKAVKLFQAARLQMNISGINKATVSGAKLSLSESLDYLSVGENELPTSFSPQQFATMLSNKRKSDVLYVAKSLAKAMNKPKDGTGLSRSSEFRASYSLVSAVFFSGAVWPNLKNPNFLNPLKLLINILEEKLTAPTISNPKGEVNAN